MNGRGIADILQDLNNTHEGKTEKTAEENTEDQPSSDEKLAQSRQALNSVLDQATRGGDESTTKEASESGQNDATEHLEKIAQDMANADMQATIKEANLFGAAVFDGFMSRANEYAQPVKTASYEQATLVPGLEKAAQAGYQAVEQVFQAAASEQEKVAHGSEEEGIVDALQKIAMASEECFERGYAHMNQLVSQLK